MNNVLTTSGNAVPAGLPQLLPSASLHTLRYRSGAVARMAGIPVSTLRIWERRYRVVAPPQTESGHRLYCGHDVQRLVLLKRLVGFGHAIGTIAMLDLEQLEALAASRAASAPVAAAAAMPAVVAVESAPAAVVASEPRLTVVAIGSNLVQRLGSGKRRGSALAARLNVVAACGELAQAESDIGTASAEVLLVQLATLHAESADRLLALARRLSARRVVVLYGFAPERVVQTLHSAGAEPRRDPVSERELEALLYPAPEAAVAGRTDAVADLSAVMVSAPRRFSARTLADIIALPTTVACECPRHLAEIVSQLASFEDYSAECLNRSAKDAVLHADMHRVAATARTLFESVLERVAQAEGFRLPGWQLAAAGEFADSAR